MNKLIFANLVHRPVRSIISVLAVAIEVIMILSIAGVFMGMLNDTKQRTSGIGADLMLRPSNGSTFAAMNGAPMPAKFADAIRKLPQLVTLCLSTYGIQASDLAPLRGHPGIEHLVVHRLQPDAGLALLLQSMPRLRDVKIELCGESKMPLDVTAELKKALPQCQVTVEEYNGP